MKKKAVSFALCLPFLACVVAPSEGTSSTSGNALVASPAVGGPFLGCICLIDPAPRGSVPTSTEHCSDCPQSSQKLTLAPGQTDVGIPVQAGVEGWPDPASVTFSISGLPSGVTATYKQASPYIPPVHGVTGAFTFDAAPWTPLGQTSVTITATSGSVSTNTSLLLTVTGVCAPATACGGACGAAPNGCSGTIQCGNCPTGQFCSSNACISTKPNPCTGGKHSCGDGTCAKICF